MAKFIRDWTEQKDNKFLALLKSNPIVRFFVFLKDKFKEIAKQ